MDELRRQFGRHRPPRRQPPIPAVRQIAPPVPPAPVVSSPPEPDLDQIDQFATVDHDERDDIIQRTPTQVYRYALLRGWGTEGAGLWAAYTAGIPLLETPAKAWTLKQVKDMVFYRDAYRNGRLRG